MPNRPFVCLVQSCLYSPSFQVFLYCSLDMGWNLWVVLASFLSVDVFPCSRHIVLGRYVILFSQHLTLLPFMLEHEQAYYLLLIMDWGSVTKGYPIRLLIGLLGQFIQLSIVVPATSLFFLLLNYCLRLGPIYVFLKLFHKYCIVLLLVS